MNPETKLILDEMHKQFADLKADWGARLSTTEEKLEFRVRESNQRIDFRLDEFEGRIESRIHESDVRIDSRLVEVEERIESRIRESEEKIETRLGLSEDVGERRFADLTIPFDVRISAVERATTACQGSIDDMKLQVGKLNKHWERTVLDRNSPLLPTFNQASGGSAPLPTPLSSTAAGRPYAAGDAVRPQGHRFNNSNREGEIGSATTILHPPVKGTFTDSLAFNSNPHYDSSNVSVPPDRSKGNHADKMPKINFPWFDGENPKLWIGRCEDYFELMDIAPHRWVKLSSMHLTEAAARWLQSVESKVKTSSWSEFGKMVLERFGRDQHEILVRQLLHIKQSSSVKDYIDRFSALIDQLAAYETQSDPLHYTMKFVYGLKEEYRSTVLMHRPSDLDAAYVLAQLQEEVDDPGPKKDYKRTDYSYSNKPPVKPALPLPSPPAVALKNSSGIDSKKPADNFRSSSAEDKWRALKSLRRAKGLCQYCAEKWSRDHKCADSVQLHVMQELLEIFQVEDDSVSSSGGAPEGGNQLFLTLSMAAVSGTPAPRTICLSGSIQGCPMKILVDSGSSHSFVSKDLAKRLSGVTPILTPLSVKVANGATLVCSEHLSQVELCVQAYTFVSDLKVLQLSAYDMILGMDWLESFSPMKIHWKQKWLSIPYKGDVAVLYGDLPAALEGTVVQVCTVQVDISGETVAASIPSEIQDLIQTFAELFEVPTALPPSRSCDHSIPLMEGVAPVQVRPYRYALALKDEIERQVKEMLQNGIIQRSSSPFCSSVLLVKKKDGSWRFCVDYRHLNAITVKGKFPVPIIDEFLDELATASWFTCLDLRAGFHQIRLKPGEEFKTAFQTHFGQFEFRVMAFGLTGAPGTFQEAMNTTLAPYLRKFVLVFFDDILIYSASYEDHLLHIKLVFELLLKDHWKIKLSKCAFAQRQINYLGHTISEKGVGTDPAKVAAISQWPIPSSAKELRSFLGLAGYYRKFVRGFGLLSKPLTYLLKKNSLFVWTTQHDNSFQALKQALCSAPVLALPNFSKPFAIETDACGTGLGAVLLQEGHPLAYISKALGPKSQGLSTYEKEYLAILMAVQQWRSYLQHSEFIIYTDQKSLT
ncbi:unnamed protein product [Urochloa humidicola]